MVLKNALRKHALNPNLKKQDNVDNYNRCLEKSENKKAPRMISYIFLRILILIFCVLFFATWRAMKTLSQVRLFRFQIFRARSEDAAWIEDRWSTEFYRRGFYHRRWTVSNPYLADCQSGKHFSIFQLLYRHDPCSFPVDIEKLMCKRVRPFPRFSPAQVVFNRSISK